MLPFNKSLLKIQNQYVFYYDRRSFIPKVNQFSNQLFIDLKTHLGIQLEIKNRIKASQSVKSTVAYAADGTPTSTILQNQYDKDKIDRIEMLYDFYVDCVLQFMQILYYKKLDVGLIYCFNDDQTKAIKALLGGAYNANWEKTIRKSMVDKLAEAADVDEKAFLASLQNSNVDTSGDTLQQCYEKAIRKCQAIKSMVQEEVDELFPIETLQDKIVKQQKIVVSTKKSVKKM